jgi:hypothetical protein
MVHGAGGNKYSDDNKIKKKTTLTLFSNLHLIRLFPKF